MKSKKTKQTELPFKPTEYQLDLLIGKANTPDQKLQFFASKNCQNKSQTKPTEE